MPPDPYTLLGVSRSASAAEIKSAYRKLAKKLHPDVNPGRADIEQKFKDVTAAYDLLSDADKRAKFDRGEIDAQGNPKGFGGGYTRSGARSHSSSRASGFSAEDIFAEFFGTGAGKARRGFHGFEDDAGFSSAPPARGADVTYEVAIPFVEACKGEKKRLTLTGGKTIDVQIPAGTEDGHKLRLRGLGEKGAGGAGDALIEIRVQPHPFFVRKENDIYLDVPLSLPEALFGGNVKIPTLEGTVALKVNRGVNTGTVMRLKGKGVPRPQGTAGDMFVTLKILLPEAGLDDLAASLEKWAKKHPYDPRKKLGWV